MTLYEIGEGFALTELGTGELAGSAEGLSLMGESFAFREMTPPEILSGGRKLELTCGKRSFMLQKEGACLNKYVELYKWAAGGEE